MNNITDAIKHLIVINIIVFVAPQLMQTDYTNILALHFPKNEHFGFWQYATHLFMHGGFAHILFNMYGLWAFGTPLEQMWGKNKFIFFYFSSGIGAGLIYTMVNYYQFNSIFELFIQAGLNESEVIAILKQGSTNDFRVLEAITQQQFNEIFALYNTPAVGASGAVYGVLVAFGMYFKDAKLALIFFPVPIAAKYFIPIMILGDLFFGVTKYSVGNIAHFAHIGGALIGFIIALYWKKNQFKIH
ncbi:MAG: rhomboid family intramembrane serine protease [Polaribacter sp.]|jgi:membrane associated rhomboid family serine protease|nr:rhomboid family intramembrane serine protease [Polaribacter sp.]MDP4703550.1 rhomboid family intramembrane serine protease [Polaribacter sp.]